MIKIGIQDLENIFANTRIRFQKEAKQSDDKYIDIFIDEIQQFFDTLNTFEFNDKMFLTNDKILSLKKYLYTLESISSNITLLYKKDNEIINEINKLINLNIYERETVINKLNKIHNFIVAHTITSEQNFDFSIYFRENFNDNSMEDKNAGSNNVDVDIYAGMLKLKSESIPIKNIDLENVKVTLSNKEKFNGNIFPMITSTIGDNLAIGDLYGIDGSLYMNQDEEILRNNLIDDFIDKESQGSPLTSCPFEMCYTNPFTIDDIKSRIDAQEQVKFGQVEIDINNSFLTRYLNKDNLNTIIPEILVEIPLKDPHLCTYIDLKFDNDIPSTIKDGGYLKGKAYDSNGNTYNLTNFDIKNNNPNFPFYRFYWGKLINLSKVQISFKAPWKNVPINLRKWQLLLGINSTLNKAHIMAGFNRIFFVEQFDSNLYLKITGEKKNEESLLNNLMSLSSSQDNLQIKV